MARKGKRSFKADVQAFATAVELDILTVMRKLALDGLTGVLKRTPVDTGRLRASWRVNLNTPDTSVEPEQESAGDGGKQGAGASEIGDALGKMTALKLGDSIHISNSVEYATYVEEDSHMLADTFTELTTQIERAIKSTKRK